MSSSTLEPETPDPAPAQPSFRFRAWNLLLLVPLVSLITPLFNVREPTLVGLPFFYWFQILVIPIGIICTLTVHLVTRHDDEEGHR
ncbi:DUF3311 domain-containing protein [Actinomycetospora termitidis]|uniref:DUF3311 domain-containing protein n=1 Tax=Actinomycetospora termitidis TaxID=3053470 RepID=A0ABT7M2X7_9PSEU|nr:DUF3311 domain-containing protein [Actinomycetospora sp. Odt1-22]MDL5155015.1 DUF3311 domain-containing protein [Actinomycetospora sp. Odt1-22]